MSNDGMAYLLRASFASMRRRKALSLMNPAASF
jgi:hypothetical protein